MIDWEKQEKEYHEKRIQRLKDKKPYERYKINMHRGRISNT